MKMPFDGHDFTILGVALAFGAGILFAKAYLVPSFPAEAAMTFFGSNPFLVRNGIVTHHEAIAGQVWLSAASIFTIIGIVRTIRAGQVGSLISSWFDILVLLAAVLVLGRLTISITDRTSRAEYLPIMISMTRELYARDSHYVLHDGLSREESMKGLRVSYDTRSDRLKHSSENLDRIGKLLDEPRREAEDDRAYTNRLSPYFPGIALTD
ncbi:MAG: hypothetical protein AB1555_01350 [Nitrospirota bacterium]